jgi:hypothetical protein
MSVRHLLFGGTYSKGVSKDNKPYEVPTLYAGKACRAWENEKGSCIAFGSEGIKLRFDPNEIILAKFETTITPALVEFTYEPDPQDPQRNLVVDFKVIKTLFDAPVETQPAKKA